MNSLCFLVFIANSLRCRSADASGCDVQGQSAAGGKEARHAGDLGAKKENKDVYYIDE